VGKETGFRTVFFIILLGTLLLATVSFQGFCQTPDRQMTEAAGHAEAIKTVLLELLPSELKQRNVPGAAVAVVERNGVFWEESWGVTDGPGSSSITLDTVFNIRSVSKNVTALGVLMAVQDGLVDLDTPIAEYLPEFTVHSRFDEHPQDLITLRLMLAHWAGFTHDPPAHLSVMAVEDNQSEYFQAYIDSISDTWLRFPVGYRHQYANRGYDLAGYILQGRSGMSFPDYMANKVFVPLGMTKSTFDLDKIEQTEGRAIGHDTDGDVVPVAFPEIPSGGLYSSVRDMSRYLQFHINGGVVNGKRLLRKDLMEQFHSIQLAKRGQRTGYTLGLWREVTGDTFSLYHEGGGRGFGSHMIVYPELGVGAVLLTNREYHGLTGFEARSLMNEPILEKRGPNPIATRGPAQGRQIGINDPLLNSILGRYSDSPGVVVGFEDGVLGLRSSEDRFSPLTIYEEGGDLMGHYGTASEIHFLHAFGGQPGSAMFVHGAFSNHNSHYAEFNDAPDDPPGPAKPEWQEYVGVYDVIWADEPYSVAEVTVRNGYLYFRDGKTREVQPGLFFHYNGEVLDFRPTPPTYATQELRKRAH
jgi:CubicO group peptidase (beta-lactamase class C family)